MSPAMDSSKSGGRDSRSDEYSGESSPAKEKIILESSWQRRSEKQSEQDSDMASIVAVSGDKWPLYFDHRRRFIGIYAGNVGRAVESVGGVGTVGFVAYY
ncbi:hypothetical protein CASFOL_024039 [Castilleja foliolosa]|uniref:Uncharacterized protein n=1 Tax=Castilleja foliolosa TaxID=1961234 RepID=A0ABD3CM86_9LAMI